MNRNARFLKSTFELIKRFAITEFNISHDNGKCKIYIRLRVNKDTTHHNDVYETDAWCFQVNMTKIYVWHVQFRVFFLKCIGLEASIVYVAMFILHNDLSTCFYDVMNNVQQRTSRMLDLKLSSIADEFMMSTSN